MPSLYNVLLCYFKGIQVQEINLDILYLKLLTNPITFYAPMSYPKNYNQVKYSETTKQFISYLSLLFQKTRNLD